MKAVVNGDNGVEVVDVDEPEGPGARLEIRSSSICGTDLNFMAMGATGFVYGHEFAGVVDGVPYAIEPTLHAELRAGNAATRIGARTAGQPGLSSTAVCDGSSCETPWCRAHLPAWSTPSREPVGGMHCVRRAALVPRTSVVSGAAASLLDVASASSRHSSISRRHPHRSWPASVSVRAGRGRVRVISKPPLCLWHRPGAGCGRARG